MGAVEDHDPVHCAGMRWNVIGTSDWPATGDHRHSPDAANAEPGCRRGPAPSVPQIRIALQPAYCPSLPANQRHQVLGRGQGAGFAFGEDAVGEGAFFVVQVDDAFFDGAAGDQTVDGDGA